MVVDPLFQRLVESVVTERDFIIPWHFSFANVEAAEQQFRFAPDVVRLEQLGNVCAFSQLEPVGSARMTSNEVD